MDALDKYTCYLGKQVTVTIDRPIGSLHPSFGFKYECNYGYLPETEAGDGKEIDAYVLGVGTHLEQYKGLCVAVIVRKNDRENKLVVAESEMLKDEIYKAVEYVERYFETELVLHSEQEK